MSNKVTISDLGSSASERYAQDQAALDPSLIRDASGIAQQAATDVVEPACSELDALLSTGAASASWARFTKPPGSSGRRRGAFMAQVFSGVRSPDEAVNKIQKILSKTLPEAKSSSWQERQELEEAKRGQTVLVYLLKKIESLEQILLEINSRRNQYQKG